jgi:hypothetical protein
VDGLDPGIATQIWFAPMIIARFLERALRVATVLAVALAVLSAPSGRSASHDPLALAAAEAERHAELVAEIAAHGHAHDDGDADEQSPGHAHGHDASDHLHDKAGAPPAFCARAGPTVHVVELSAAASIGRAASMPGLKRPPRPILDA